MWFFKVLTHVKFLSLNMCSSVGALFEQTSVISLTPWPGFTKEKESFFHLSSYQLYWQQMPHHGENPIILHSKSFTEFNLHHENHSYARIDLLPVFKETKVMYCKIKISQTKNNINSLALIFFFWKYSNYCVMGPLILTNLWSHSARSPCSE